MPQETQARRGERRSGLDEAGCLEFAADVGLTVAWQMVK